MKKRTLQIKVCIVEGDAFCSLITPAKGPNTLPLGMSICAMRPALLNSGGMSPASSNDNIKSGYLKKSLFRDKVKIIKYYQACGSIVIPTHLIVVQQ